MEMGRWNAFPVPMFALLCFKVGLLCFVGLVWFCFALVGVVWFGLVVSFFCFCYKGRCLLLRERKNNICVLFN